MLGTEAVDHCGFFTPEQAWKVKDALAVIEHDTQWCVSILKSDKVDGEYYISRGIIPPIRRFYKFNVNVGPRSPIIMTAIDLYENFLIEHGVYCQFMEIFAVYGYAPNRNTYVSRDPETGCFYLFDEDEPAFVRVNFDENGEEFVIWFYEQFNRVNVDYIRKVHKYRKGSFFDAENFRMLELAFRILNTPNIELVNPASELTSVEYIPETQTYVMSYDPKIPGNHVYYRAVEGNRLELDKDSPETRESTTARRLWNLKLYIEGEISKLKYRGYKWFFIYKDLHHDDPVLIDWLVSYAEKNRIKYEHTEGQLISYVPGVPSGDVIICVALKL